MAIVLVLPFAQKRCKCKNYTDENLIWDNGKDIKRCEAGGSCIPNQRLGAIVFGVPALEHEGFVGSRGGGVVIEPSKLQKHVLSQMNKVVMLSRIRVLKHLS